MKYRDAGNATWVIAETALALALYAAPSPATHQARLYEKRGRTHDARLMRKLAKVPQGVWITGPKPRKTVARVMKRAAGKVPLLVAYDLPRRDCHAKGYGKWIDGFAKGIGAQRAIVILEPDALPSGCGASALPHAVKRLKRAKRATVYVDAGHSKWLPAETAAARLAKVGATAFSLNVSNFRSTPELARYGHRDLATARECPLRDRHEPQWTRTQGRRVVQPTGPRPRHPPHDGDRQPADRRLPVDQGPGRVRRHLPERATGGPLVAAVRARPRTP